MPNYDYEHSLFEYLENLKSQLYIRPLNLGGTSDIEGGSGGPPGGFIGYLPQGRVAYDTSEIAYSGLPVSGISLLDNLNHIRYRIQTLEDNPTSPLSVWDNGSPIASGVTVISFSGFIVSNDSTIVYVSNSGIAGDSFNVNDFACIYVTRSGIATKYEATSTGLTNALAGALINSSVLLNGCDITGDFTVPNYVTLDGSGTSIIRGKIDATYGSTIRNLSIIKEDYDTTDLVYGIKIYNTAPNVRDVTVENCYISIRNINATPGEYACIYLVSASYCYIRSNTLYSYRNAIHTNVTNHLFISGNYLNASNYAFYSTSTGYANVESNYIEDNTPITNDYGDIIGTFMDYNSYEYLINSYELTYLDWNSSNKCKFRAPSLTATRTYTLPDKSGTVAMTSDIKGTFTVSGLWQPASAPDDSAPNNSVYYSTTQEKLVYKTASGIVNALY